MAIYPLGGEWIDTCAGDGVMWYRTLPVDKRIVFKAEVYPVLFGITWESFSYIFSMRDRIEFAHAKLKKEGILTGA